MPDLWTADMPLCRDCETIALQKTIPGYVTQPATTIMRLAVINRGDTEMHDTPLCDEHAAFYHFLQDTMGHLVRARQQVADAPERKNEWIKRHTAC